jgi:hypothetical protein
MKHETHLAAFGNWGTSDPPAFTYALTSAAAFKQAKLRGKGFRNVRVINDGNVRQALILAPSIIAVSAAVDLSAWSSVTGPVVLAQHLNAFRQKDTPSLAHESMAPGHYKCDPAIWGAEKNGGHALRVFIPQPPSRQAGGTGAHIRYAGVNASSKFAMAARAFNTSPAPGLKKKNTPTRRFSG